jgi:hypothetical protein
MNSNNDHDVNDTTNSNDDNIRNGITRTDVQIYGQYAQATYRTP